MATWAQNAQTITDFYTSPGEVTQWNWGTAYLITIIDDILAGYTTNVTWGVQGFPIPTPLENNVTVQNVPLFGTTGVSTKKTRKYY
jgi:hypothetical protein